MSLNCFTIIKEWSDWVHDHSRTNLTAWGFQKDGKSKPQSIMAQDLWKDLQDTKPRGLTKMIFDKRTVTDAKRSHYSMSGRWNKRNVIDTTQMEITGIVFVERERRVLHRLVSEFNRVWDILSRNAEPLFTANRRASPQALHGTNWPRRGERARTAVGLLWSQMASTSTLDVVRAISGAQARLIDYRCGDRRKFGELRGAIWLVLTHYFRKPRSSPPQNEPFNKEKHLKILHLSRGSKLSNSKPGCRVSAIHSFVK